MASEWVAGRIGTEKGTKDIKVPGPYPEKKPQELGRKQESKVRGITRFCLLNMLV